MLNSSKAHLEMRTKYLKSFYVAASLNWPSLIVLIFSILLNLVLCITTEKTWLLKYFPAIALGIFFNAILIYAVICTIYQLYNMILYTKPKSPIRHLIESSASFARDYKRFSYFLFVLATFSTFATSFSINKGLIFQINGFKWDQALHNLDVWLFGKPPFEYFSWMFNRQIFPLLLELCYQLWFWVYYFTIAYVGHRFACCRISQIYLLSSVLTWFIGGNLIAIAVSSAGPIFIEIHQIDDYANHLQKMSEALPYMESFAIGVKSALLEAFNNVSMSSISAFPSMHVASTALIVLVCRGISQTLFNISLTFLIMIFLGSFILLWHFLIDSIAGLLLAITFWRLANFIYGHGKLTFQHIER